MAVAFFPILGIPDAGALYDEHGFHAFLVARLGDVAIDQRGRLISLDRACEWPDCDFFEWDPVNWRLLRSWFHWRTCRDACWVVEKMVMATPGTINRWNIEAVCRAVAATVLEMHSHASQKDAEKGTAA
jgi:hypothetical protein